MLHQNWTGSIIRYANGDDREGLDKVSMKLTPEEEEILNQPIEYSF